MKRWYLILIALLLLVSVASATIDVPPCYAEILQNGYPVSPSCIAMANAPGDWWAQFVAWYQQWIWVIRFAF